MEWNWNSDLRILCEKERMPINMTSPLPTKFNPLPNKPWFLRVCSTSLLKTLLEKEKLLVTSNFSFFHSVFFSFAELSCHFHQIWNCRLQTLFFFLSFWWALCHFQQIWNCRLQTLLVWKSLKLVIWEGLSNFSRTNLVFWDTFTLLPTDICYS